MRLIVVLLVIVLGWSSAAQGQGYTRLSDDIAYKLCRVSTSKARAGKGGFVRIGFSGTLPGQLPLVSDQCMLSLPQEPDTKSLSGTLATLALGDSAEFILTYGVLNNTLINFEKAKGVGTSDKVVLGVRIMEVYPFDIVFEPEYASFLKQYAADEQKAIKRFAKQHHQFKPRGDMLYRTLKEGNGKQLSKAGDIAMVHYQGRFLNGQVVDEGTLGHEPFKYVKGQQFQLLKGLALVVGAMSEGEKMQLCIPSHLAFGDKGLADIVPPYTPVLYEIEIVKIVKR